MNNEFNEVNTDLESLKNDAIENINETTPIEKPADGVEGIGIKHSRPISFKGAEGSICICAHCIRCPAK